MFTLVTPKSDVANFRLAPVINVCLSPKFILDNIAGKGSKCVILAKYAFPTWDFALVVLNTSLALKVSYFFHAFRLKWHAQRL